jgi:hypothetical protein
MQQQRAGEPRLWLGFYLKVGLFVKLIVAETRNLIFGCVY